MRIILNIQKYGETKMKKQTKTILLLAAITLSGNVIADFYSTPRFGGGTTYSDGSYSTPRFGGGYNYQD